MSQRCPSCKFPVPDAQWEEGVCGWCGSDVHAVVVEDDASDEQEKVVRVDDLDEERSTNNSLWPILVPIAGLAVLFLALWTPVGSGPEPEKAPPGARRAPTIDPERYAKARAEREAREAKALEESGHGVKKKSPESVSPKPDDNAAVVKVIKPGATISFAGKPLIVEAEDGKIVGKDVQIYQEGDVGYVSVKNRPGAGPNHVQAPTKGRLLIRVKVDKPTQIRLHAHTKSPTGSDNDNSFFVGAVPGKKTQTPNMTALHGAPKKEWIWAPSQAMRLEAGINTIIIAGREEGAMLDKIRISPVDDAGPTQAKKFVVRFNGKPVVVEAETAGKIIGDELKVHAEGNKHFVSAKKRKDAQHQRTKPSAGRLLILVEVDQPMHVRLHGLAKCPTGTDDNNSFFVGAAHGEQTNAPKFEVWGTSNRRDWQWGTSPPVRLKAGMNTIIIAAREEGTMLDKIRISR